MAFKFDIKSVFFAGLLVGACAPETPDPTRPGAAAGNATAETKDAGKAADAGAAGKDAGKKDAGSATGDEDEGDEPEDDATDETEDEDDSDEPVKPVVDAGKADAGGSGAGDAGGAKDAGGSTGDAGSGGDTCADLTYEKFGKTFLDTYCISCHGKMAPTFSTLAQVVTHKASIKAEAATATAMPPKGSKAPTAVERTKLGKWIDCGPK